MGNGPLNRGGNRLGAVQQRMDRRRSQKWLVEREFHKLAAVQILKAPGAGEELGCEEDFAAGIVPQDSVAALVAAALVVTGNLTAAVTGDEPSTRQKRSRPVR